MCELDFFPVQLAVMTGVDMMEKSLRLHYHDHIDKRLIEHSLIELGLVSKWLPNMMDMGGYIELPVTRRVKRKVDAWHRGGW